MTRQLDALVAVQCELNDAARTSFMRATLGLGQLREVSHNQTKQNKTGTTGATSDPPGSFPSRRRARELARVEARVVSSSPSAPQLWGVQPYGLLRAPQP